MGAARCRRTLDLSTQFGLPVDVSSKLAGLRTIAQALNSEDVARAQVAALLLRIPEAPDLFKSASPQDAAIAFIRELHWSGLLGKLWDPDEHPRWPAGAPDSQGGEFAPLGTGNTSSAVIETSGIQVAANNLLSGINSGPDASFDRLMSIANEAYKANPLTVPNSVPPLSWLRGIQIHSYFAARVRALGPNYAAEISYKNGGVVEYGTPGSVRADAVYGNVEKPTYVVELKSGMAAVTPAETHAYKANLPAGTPIYGIVEVPGP